MSLVKFSLCFYHFLFKVGFFWGNEMAITVSLWVCSLPNHKVEKSLKRSEQANTQLDTFGLEENVRVHSTETNCKKYNETIIFLATPGVQILRPWYPLWNWPVQSGGTKCKCAVRWNVERNLANTQMDTISANLAKKIDLIVSGYKSLEFLTSESAKWIHSCSPGSAFIVVVVVVVVHWVRHFLFIFI